MSKKDYILIAKILKSRKPSLESHRYNPWVWYVAAFAEGLKAENPKFNVDKFYKACDYNELD